MCQGRISLGLRLDLGLWLDLGLGLNESIVKPLFDPLNSSPNVRKAVHILFRDRATDGTNDCRASGLGLLRIFQTDVSNGGRPSLVCLRVGMSFDTMFKSFVLRFCFFLGCKGRMGHDASIGNCAFTRDGQLACSSSYDGTVKVWRYTRPQRQ